MKYPFDPDEWTPKDVVRYFEHSASEDWIEDDGVWGSKINFYIRIDPTKDGQVLLYADLAIAYVDVDFSLHNGRRVVKALIP